MFEKVVIMIAMSQVHWAEFEIPALDPPGHSMVGHSSWYGSGISNDFGLHGSITATGEPFDPSRKTCATRSTPLRRMVRVKLLRNGRSILCLVNDRGPYGAILESGEWALKLSSSDPGDWRGIIDLSRASAEAIGFDFNSGLEEVEVSW